MGIYDLNAPLNTSAMTVSNVFADSLCKLANSIYNEGKIAVIDLGSKKSRKGTVNIAAMPPIVQAGGFRTLLDEVSMYRMTSRGAMFTPTFNYLEHREVLFLDYLLSMCLCYVEIDNPNYNPSVQYSQRIDKFYATRNIGIVKAMCEIEDSKEAKMRAYLNTIEGEYSADSIRLIKINEKKEGYSMTQPRSAITVGKRIRVMPMFMMQAFLGNIHKRLNMGIVEFTYLKDDGSTRQLCSTLNQRVYDTYYKDMERTQKVMGNVQYKLSRGYIKIPELGLSRYDESGVRSLNLMRVVSMKSLQEVDATFIDVDIAAIIPQFKRGVEQAYKNGSVSKLYENVLRTSCCIPDLQASSALLSWVDTQNVVGSTTFLRSLHKYMLTNREFFGFYTGKRDTNAPVVSGGLFGDLGIASND